MALVIVHPELLLDQVGHTRAGPQWGFIAQSLGTREQKLAELVPLLLAQAWLAARMSGFLERRFASGAILLHPAGYRLTDNFYPASNLGLIPPLFEQANGLEAAVL